MPSANSSSICPAYNVPEAMPVNSNRLVRIVLMAADPEKGWIKFV